MVRQRSRYLDIDSPEERVIAHSVLEIAAPD